MKKSYVEIGQDEILFFGRARKSERDLLISWLSFLAVIVIWGFLLVLTAEDLAGPAGGGQAVPVSVVAGGAE